MNRREALRFVRRVLVFLAPLLVVGLGLQLALWRVGEAWSMDAVLAFESEQLAQGRETLFARALVSEEMRRYKGEKLRRRAPQVAILGSSTTMQFRDFHFGPYAGEFYNAGGLVQHPGDLEALAERFDRDGWPRFIGLGLDLWWFNTGWSRSARIEPLERIEATSAFDADFAARTQAFPAAVELLGRGSGRQLLAGLFGASPLARTGGDDAEPVRIGLGARDGAGFRGSDGSRRNARFLARVAAGAPYEDDEKTLRRIERAHKRFQRGEFAPSRAREVSGFLEHAKARGAIVAGFAIPLDSEVRAALRSSQGHAGLLAGYQQAMRDLFIDAQLPYVDAVDHFDLDDRWMINGFHGSERSMAHIVRVWAQHPAARSALSELRAVVLDCLIAEADRDGLVEGPGSCLPGGSVR